MVARTGTMGNVVRGDLSIQHKRPRQAGKGECVIGEGELVIFRACAGGQEGERRLLRRVSEAFGCFCLLEGRWCADTGRTVSEYTREEQRGHVPSARDGRAAA